MLLKMPALDLPNLLQRRLLFVGGKGGVGKTSVAAGLATIAARSGKRTLLVSTDPAHNLGDLFGFAGGAATDPVALDPPPLPPESALGDSVYAPASLFGLELNPEQVLDDYLAGVRQQMLAYIAVGLRPQLEQQLKLSRHSPGAEEAALLDVLTRIIQRRDDYDLIIFDTAPTGHTLRLINLPRIMSAWTDGLLTQKQRSGRFADILAHLKSGGDIHNPVGGDKQGAADVPRELQPLLDRQARFRESVAVLKDASETGFVFVMTAETLPLQETRRAASALNAAGIPIVGLIINRLLPESAQTVEFLQGALQLQDEVLLEVGDVLGEIPQLRLPMSGTVTRGRVGLGCFVATLLQAAELCEGQKQKLPDSEAVGQL
ncbi:ArsA family ATPase [Microbulbifer bruguierae]|uniref:arsenite-transporting ATPase n=2 Tax=Microbulbifer bruguierae TaxID=3029061 RepID=A0ABY8NFV4_9GAMM|nr:ArsA family ATPase [Microbulbifer bruguierae]WGL16942.1 ArsA family ATPase [Microbulbifer bruguierae]